MKAISLYFFLLSISFYCFAQTQTLRGTVTDADSKIPLIGVNVVVMKDSALIAGATTNEDGIYRLENIPVGRFKVKFSYIGYQQQTVSDVIVTSAKEVVLNISLSESVNEINEVVVSAFKPGETKNEMATVSARPFTIEETDRYAGSRGDPARMASNFAGVSGADDSRNDIVIRGNSPSGVLFKLEGVPILNPNHFNIPGTTGSPVTILNNKFLANSDFFTGAFPVVLGKLS